MSLNFCSLFAAAHLCSFLCQASTQAASVSCSPVFTSVLLAGQCLLGSAASLRHVSGFPGLGLLRRLRHSWDIRGTSPLGLAANPSSFPRVTHVHQVLGQLRMAQGASTIGSTFMPRFR